MIEKLVPEAAREYVHEHPKVLVWGCALLVAGCLYNLVDSIGLYHKAKAIAALHSDHARAASEALGG